MRVFDGLDSAQGIVRPVVTLGSYDGVHRGHREILRKLRQIAAERGGESVLLTFAPHPREVLYPESAPRLLNTPAEKLALLEELGIDNVVVIPFTEAFSRIGAEEFVRDILVGGLHTDTLIVGFNHHLGHGKQGTPDALRAWSGELGFRLEEMPRQELGEEKVSSTLIRGLVAAGKMTEAERYLGAPYRLSGTLSNGAITDVDPGKLLPPPGDYPVEAFSEGETWKTRLQITPESLKLQESPFFSEQKSFVRIKFS